MSFLDKIDMLMPITFYATIYEQITDPEMVRLSVKMNNPNFLKCSTPMPGATELVISDPVAVKLILDWLNTSDYWRRKIEETLQELAEDKDGRPLLTAFMPIDDLVKLGKDLHLHEIQDLRAVFEKWKAMGAAEGTIDTYKISSETFQSSI